MDRCLHGACSGFRSAPRGRTFRGDAEAGLAPRASEPAAPQRPCNVDAASVSCGGHESLGPGPAGALPRKTETRAGEAGRERRASQKHVVCGACRERPGHTGSARRAGSVLGAASPAVRRSLRERGPAGVDPASEVRPAQGSGGGSEVGRPRQVPPWPRRCLAETEQALPSASGGRLFEGLVSTVKKKCAGSFATGRKPRVGRGLVPRPHRDPDPRASLRGRWAGRTGRECACACGRAGVAIGA